MGVSDRRHKQDYISVDALVPMNWNANEQDEATFDMLVDEIAETGCIDSLTVVPLKGGDYGILSGEHRWRAAKAAGEVEVPCLILQGKKWKEEDLQKFASVKMNIIKGKLSPLKFASLYNEMADKYGKDQLQRMFGFTDKKVFNKLLSGVVKGAKKALPKELHSDLEEKAKEAKTAQDLGTIVQEMFAKYGDTMRHSFMIMTHGRQEHLYIRMNTPMRKAMDKVMEYCELAKVDINSFMEPVVSSFLSEALEKLESYTSPEETSSDNPF